MMRDVDSYMTEDRLMKMYEICFCVTDIRMLSVLRMYR